MEKRVLKNDKVNNDMHKWRKGVDITVRVGEWSAAERDFLFENAGQSLVQAQIVSFVLCLSDLVKRHLSCVSWPKDISICHFQIRDGLPGSVLVACPCQHFVKYILVFSLELPVSSLWWARDWTGSTWASVLPYFWTCQVLSSFNISTNSAVRNN